MLQIQRSKEGVGFSGSKIGYRHRFDHSTRSKANFLQAADNLRERQTLSCLKGNELRTRKQVAKAERLTERN